MAVTTRRIFRALAVLATLSVLLLAVAFVAPPADAVGSPTRSLVRLVEDVFPPRRLTIREIDRGGPTCVQGDMLVLAPGGGCTFIVPNNVHVVLLRRVAGSPGMMITFSRTGDLTQTFDTGKPGPDPSDPLALRVAIFHDGTTVTLYSCQGPSACRLTVEQ